MTDHLKAPVVTVDSKNLTESGFIIHSIISNYPNSSVESSPSDDSIFWSHFSEGSMMTLFQGGAAVGAIAGGFSKGMMGEVDEGEKKGIDKFARFFAVSLFTCMIG
jgi:glutathione S-transferase